MSTVAEQYSYNSHAHSEAIEYMGEMPYVVDPNEYMDSLAQRADQLPSDGFSRAKARRFIARVAMDDVYIDPASTEAPNTSLLESLKRAKDGDVEALDSVRINAHIAVVEAMIKSGHISQVSMSINEQGNWLQFGQAMLHVHANALRTSTTRKYYGVQERTEAETINGQRIEDLGRAGILDDYYFFVPSLIPSEEELPFAIATQEAGFFGDTMTVALQLTSIQGGEGVIESAFVSGVKEKGGERYDIAVLRRMYALVGYDCDNWQPIDFLQTPLIIHKENAPHGIADIVQLYDELAEAHTGTELYFGQQIAKQDYSSFNSACQTRESTLQSVTDMVVQKLIMCSDQLTTPDNAIEKLSEIVGPLGVAYAVSDSTIDPSVFGDATAKFIHQAREYQHSGEIFLMQQAIHNAVDNAIITMCGMTNSKSAIDLEATNLQSSSHSSSDEDCEFISKKCPVCGAKNVKTISTKHKISGSCGCEVRK